MVPGGQAVSATRADVVEEALRIAEAADEAGIALRLLGGVAIWTCYGWVD